MSTLSELAHAHTSLGQPEVAHLQRLVAAWNLVADLCFADLLLYAPRRPELDAEAEQGAPRGRYVVLGQVRPSTSQTLYPGDLLGLHVDEAERSVCHRAFRSGEVVEGASPRDDVAEPVRMLAIPVRSSGRVVAVVSREWAPSTARHHGELENAYLSVFDRFARMISLGEFPFPEADGVHEDRPRVGDGALLLDGEERVRYCSPNASSALHRLGVLADVTGRTLGELGLDEAVVRQARSGRVPVMVELSDRGGASVQAYCVPLLERREVVGGLVLLRDVSALRRLDRLLVTKDTHIREIHHRVKNNLQTISSLLRIQARRVGSPEARQAIEESVRRIGSIAVVHETLSREANDDLPFADVARPLVRMVEETLLSPDRPIYFRLSGDAITLPAAVATPLALVLTELLQNAVDHAFADRVGAFADRVGAVPDGVERDIGHVDIELRDVPGGLLLSISDDGTGLPLGFDLESNQGLGMSIVRALVQSELGGSLSMRNRPDGAGAVIELFVPVLSAD
ncbi:MAG: ATPase [Acidimicrobiia bacterium]|nr:ATPase [Acidimicrobiia bacterium]